MTEADYRCPDCGRETCTGEDCSWPDEAGIPRPERECLDILSAQAGTSATEGKD